MTVDPSSNTLVDLAATTVVTTGLTPVGQWRRIVPESKDVALALPGECVVFTASRGAGSGTIDAEVTANWQEPL